MAGTTGIPAQMGYIGGVKLFGQAVRVTSCGLTPKQKIDHPEVIDGTVDHTLYGLGGIEIDGDAKFPVVTGSGFESFIWEVATSRDSNTGELTKTGQVIIEYANGNGRTFDGCRVNTLELRASAGQTVEGTTNIWAVSYDDGGDVGPFSGPPDRILQWSDVVLSGTDIRTCNVKEVTVQINNNLSRNYTFCPESGLFPNNISTGKRMINGSLTFQGFAPTDGQASSNRNKAHPDAALEIYFGDLHVKFNNIVWEFQNIEAQPGILTSTANYYPHADGGGTAISIS